MIRVTVEDIDTGETEIREIKDDYILVCAGRYHLTHTNLYPRSGTVQLTVKVEKDSET